jgi:hypothetical protein
MDAAQLLRQAASYRRSASSVSDTDTANALLELAEKYESLAAELTNEEPTQGAAEC